MRSGDGDLTPGREFHGTVESGNHGRFSKGDHVMGVIHPLANNGALSEFVNVSGIVGEIDFWELIFVSLDCSLVPAPSYLTPSECAALPFTAMTFLSSIGAFKGALSLFGSSPLGCGKDFNSFGRGKRVLVVGATGGLGSLAVQILVNQV